MEDRRNFARARVRLNTFIKFPDSGKVVRVLTNNVGGKGICFTGEVSVKPGSCLDVELVLPDREQHVAFAGEVVWCREAEKSHKSYREVVMDVGVRFVDMDQEDLSIIMQYTAMNALPPKSESGEM